jgi:cyclophilin family peptidyl-prolyl cis-trans isomerase
MINIRGYRFILLAFSVITNLVCIAQNNEQPPLPSQIDFQAKSPDSFLVKFTTTKGDFNVLVHRGWAPLAANRFYQLVSHHFYDGCVIYRVAQAKSCNGAFVVQFGMVNNQRINKAWEALPFNDEPVTVPQRAGGVVFARGGPNTRSYEVAVTVTACPEMDTIRNGAVKGFPTFAEVETGLDVIKQFNSKYGNSVFDHEDSLSLGRAYFDRAYPGLDRIIKAVIVE